MPEDEKTDLNHKVQALTRIWFRRYQGITRTFAVIEKKTAVLNGHT